MPKHFLKLASYMKTVWKMHGEIPGLMIYHTGSQQDIEDVYKYYGKDLIIFCNVPTELILSGSAEEAYDETKRQILACKKYCKKGSVVCSSCTIPAYSPPINIYAMVKATEDFGAFK